MNKRIKELCEKSKVYANECTKDFTGDEPVLWMDYYTDKFVELIIDECCEHVRYIDAMKIHKHFRVEE